MVQPPPQEGSGSASTQDSGFEAVRPHDTPQALRDSAPRVLWGLHPHGIPPKASDTALARRPPTTMTRAHHRKRPLFFGNFGRKAASGSGRDFQ